MISFLQYSSQSTVWYCCCIVCYRPTKRLVRIALLLSFHCYLCHFCFCAIFLHDHFGLTTEPVYTLLVTASAAWLSFFIWFSWVIPPAKQEQYFFSCHWKAVKGREYPNQKTGHCNCLKFLLDHIRALTGMGSSWLLPLEINETSQAILYYCKHTRIWLQPIITHLIIKNKPVKSK